MDSEQLSGSKAKKPYVAPSFKVISLDPKEAKMIQDTFETGAELTSEQQAAIKECIDRKRQA